MIKNFIHELNGKNFKHGEKLESEALIVAQKVLCNMGLDFIPKSYADFLRHYNGIKFDGSYLFGATIDDELDIIDMNEKMNKPHNCILLGYNDFDLLCYNYKLKEYQIIDRSDSKILDTYSEENVDFALNKIFKF